MTFAGRSVLITGGSRGIGFAIARRFGLAGDRVAISGRGATSLALARRNLAAEGMDVLAQEADMAQADSVAAMVDVVRARFGGIDVLVCNAGINPNRGRTVLATDLADWDAVMATNLRGVFLCLKSVVPLMQARRRGWIITIGSIGGRVVPDDANCAYRASKFGVRGLTWSLAKALRRDNIAVSSILPGSTRTAMTGGAALDASLEADDVAVVATFLAGLDPRVVVPEISVSPRSDIGGQLCPYS